MKEKIGLYKRKQNEGDNSMNQIFFILNHTQNLFFLGALRGKKFLKICGIQGIRANLRQPVQVSANPWHKSARRRLFKARRCAPVAQKCAPMARRGSQNFIQNRISRPKSKKSMQICVNPYFTKKEKVKGEKSWSLTQSQNPR